MSNNQADDCLEHRLAELLLRLTEIIVRIRVTAGLSSQELEALFEEPATMVDGPIRDLIRRKLLDTGRESEVENIYRD